MSKKHQRDKHKAKPKPPQSSASEVAEVSEESNGNETEAVEASEALAAVGEAVSVEELGIEEHQPAVETQHSRLRALVEAAVYITDEPLQAAQIAGVLGHPLDQVQQVLDELVADYTQPHHGLFIRELAGGYQMATKAEHHEDLRQFVKKLVPPFKLSLAALETLAVIAYKQPVTAPEILEIRGVQGAGVLKTLLDRKLVMVSGRKNVLGKPALYKTTKEFLVQFGLKDLTELPTLKEFEELSRMAFGEDEGNLGEGEADQPAADQQLDTVGEALPAVGSDGANETLAPEDAPAAAPEQED